MRAFGWLTAGSLAAAPLAAQEMRPEVRDTGGIVIRPATARLTIDRLDLPRNEGLTLVGTAYLVDAGSGFAFGPAIFGAASGERGGLFSIGAELAWRRHLFGPLHAEAGVYLGGAGGGSLAVDDGLMMRPHLDLLYDFGAFNLGLSWSRVRFAGTPIGSTQVGLVLSANTDFSYVPRERMGSPMAAVGRPGAGFDRLVGVLGVYRPHGDNTRVGGGALPDSIGIVGLRAERAFNSIGYWGLEANVGTQGGVTGYAEYLGTVGVETGIGDQTFALGTRAALGMAGGGNVSTGGGLIGKATVYGAMRLSREVATMLEVGVARAPQGNFKAVQASANLIWIFDDSGNVFSPSRTTRSEFSAGVEHFDAARADGSTRSLSAVVLKASRFLDRNLYVTGQAHSAFDGGAGGYAAGLFGVGYQAAFGGGNWPSGYLGLEALLGAGGGGGVDVRNGVLVQPKAYVGFDLGPSSSLRLGVGHLRSRRGSVDAGVVDIAYAFSFGLAGQGVR